MTTILLAAGLATVAALFLYATIPLLLEGAHDGLRTLAALRRRRP
jgi:hypothetical protein